MFKESVFTLFTDYLFHFFMNFSF